jgi:hypothetical protein
MGKHLATSARQFIRFWLKCSCDDILANRRDGGAIGGMLDDLGVVAARNR